MLKELLLRNEVGKGAGRQHGNHVHQVQRGAEMLRQVGS
jgi:hypothetical protein